jgi:hypothetical protein
VLYGKVEVCLIFENLEGDYADRQRVGELDVMSILVPLLSPREGEIPDVRVEGKSLMDDPHDLEVVDTSTQPTFLGQIFARNLSHFYPGEFYI